MNSKNNCEFEKSFCGFNVIENNVLEGDLYENAINSKNNKGVKLSEGVDNKVEPSEIKERFDEFGVILRDHDGRLKTLEISWAKQEESLANVKQGQEDLKKGMDKIEGQMLTNHNAMLSGLNSLIINKQDNLAKIEVSKNESESKIETAKIDGKSKVYMQICILIGSIIATGGTVYITMK